MKHFKRFHHRSAENTEKTRRKEILLSFNAPFPVIASLWLFFIRPINQHYRYATKLSYTGQQQSILTARHERGILSELRQKLWKLNIVANVTGSYGV